MSADTFTRWGIVASGEGGGRIASNFFARTENPGIDDRILVMNTNRADIRNTINRIESQLDLGGEDIWQSKALEFGDLPGAGNFFADGEQCAREDLDEIVGRIDQELTAVDAMLHVATLGGGTGNGSVPYLVRTFKGGLDVENHRPWMDEVVHVALAAWPFDREPPQRHFNAICGLSRLLRTPDGGQNANMTLLAANSQFGDADSGESDYEAVNQWLVSAIDLLIGAGRETRDVIDVRDFFRVPSQIGAYHFTPAVATGMNGEMFELEYLFGKAAENPFVPMDATTSRAAFAVVRAPTALIESGKITGAAVGTAFENWKRENGIDAPGMTTLTPVDRSGSDVDVLLLLGGFDLRPLVDRSWGAYERHRENLAAARSLGDDRLSEADLDRIERNLTEYMEINEG